MADKNLELDFTTPVEAAPPPEPAAPPAKPEVRVMSVAELGRAMAAALSRTFERDVWVEGEITQANAATRGHVYLSLKDAREQARLDVTIFRSDVTPRVRELLREGVKIKVRGRPSFYAQGGRLQFIGNRVEATGDGALLLALERLKKKLAAEGLFADERKRSLPVEPRRIGVVTSLKGAVIHDICKVAFRRGGARILISNAQVQGTGSADSVVRALRRLYQVGDVDVIIVARGGGSAEDLMCFNDEAVVRAVAASPVPVVSAVGHEVDVTLTDFVADRRAATPSQAAELVVLDRRAQKVKLEQQVTALGRAIETQIHRGRSALLARTRRVEDPRILLAGAQQHKDELDVRLGAVMHRSHKGAREAISRLSSRLAQLHPKVTIARERARLVALRARLDRDASSRAAKRRADLARAEGRLAAMSPLAVLGRGYAIATKADGRAVRRPSEVSPGETIRVRVAEGAFGADVLPGGGEET